MGIVVDTSVWADHFRSPDQRLTALVQQGEVLMHSYAIGELALGSFRDRATSLRLLRNLPPATVLAQRDLVDFVEIHGLVSSGIGFVDAHLLASAYVAHAKLWTRDKRLRQRAEALGCSSDEA
ncbi:type II toxin-antitoxin system VapC family toxin [Sphingomonas sp.]|uniref:type II toxin-antitoxin system VapC family toxin n=1 Tax=Sphingomonas sp. TaxID=28214 RepID=UPI0035C803BE